MSAKRRAAHPRVCSKRAGMTELRCISFPSISRLADGWWQQSKRKSDVKSLRFIFLSAAYIQARGAGAAGRHRRSSLSLKEADGSRHTLSEFSALPPVAAPPASRGPPGRAIRRQTARRVQPEAGDRPFALLGRRGEPRGPRSLAPEVARPAHAHGLASTATFGGAICAFIALWIVLAPIGLLPTVGGAHSVHFESDSLFGRHALRRKVAAGCPRRASQLPARTAASSSRQASTSTRSSFCRCVLVASRAAVKVCPDERQAIVPSLFALCMSGQAAAGHDHRAALLQPDVSHCAQPPEHHHRPASCHGELLLHPFARLLRWHTSAFRCSRSASSSPHSCHGAVATHLLAGLSHADSISLPLWCTPRAATAAGSRPA